MAVTLVQKVVGSEGILVTSGNATLPGASTTGNTLVVGIQLFGNGASDVLTPITSVSDGTNTFSHLAVTGGDPVQSGGADYWTNMQFYAATNITGKATEKVTVNFTGNGFVFVLIWELTPSVYDQGVAATGHSATPSAGSFTPSANGAFAIAIFGEDGQSSGTWTPTSGWTADQGGFAGLGGEAATHIAQSTAAALTAGQTLGAGTAFWAANAVCFKPPGSVQSGAASLTGSFTLSSAAKVTHTGAASPSGALTLSATGRATRAGAAHPTAALTLVCVARVTHAGSASLSGLLALDATARALRSGSASLSAHLTLTAAVVSNVVAASVSLTDAPVFPSTLVDAPAYTVFATDAPVYTVTLTEGL